MVFAIIWLANMGGIGGGGMVVPIAILLLRFDPNNAIALSNFSIFLSGLIRYYLNRHKPHPLKNGNGVLVDYNVGTLMLPGMISGVSLGGTINIMTP